MNSIKNKVVTNYSIDIVNNSLLDKPSHSKEDFLNNFSRPPPRKSELLPDDSDGDSLTIPLPLWGGLDYIGVIISNEN